MRNTRVYVYGLRRLLEGREQVEQQIYLAHRYYNRLIEIERARRERIGKDAAQKDAAQQEADTARRQARAESGLYWGNYLLVEQAVEAARRRKEPPKFQGWADGAGRLGVQFQKGVAIAKLYDGDTRMRLTSPRVYPGRAISNRYDPARGIGHATVSVRVGSGEKGKPIWATWEMMQHRPLPTDAVLKWAVVVRRIIPGRSGPGRFRDELQLTVEAETERDAKAAPSGAVAIDLGWRRTDDGIRVMTACDNVGRSATYVLPPDIEESFRHSDMLRSIRDGNLTRMQQALLAVRPAWPEHWPDRLRASLAAMAQWRAQRRFAALLSFWSRNRFAGDEQAYRLLEQWWRGGGEFGDHGDRHLSEYEHNCRRTAVGRRRDLYRRWAAEITRRYQTIVLERFRLTKVSRKDTCDRPASRAQKHTAAPGEMRRLLQQAAARRGCEVVFVSAKDTTRRCHVCGSIEKWNQADEVLHTCSACGAMWDQDDNAARNLLTLWREQGGGAEGSGDARGPAGSGTYAATHGGRWARRKRAKQERSQVVAQVAGAG